MITVKFRTAITCSFVLKDDSNTWLLNRIVTFTMLNVILYHISIYTKWKTLTNSRHKSPVSNFLWPALLIVSTCFAVKFQSNRDNRSMYFKTVQMHIPVTSWWISVPQLPVKFLVEKTLSLSVSESGNMRPKQIPATHTWLTGKTKYLHSSQLWGIIAFYQQFRHMTHLVDRQSQ